MTEEILDPDLPIIDPHHHLWDRRGFQAPAGSHPFLRILGRTPYYMFDELRADAGSGHRVVGTVFVECGAFYRADGPDSMKPVGEVEFVNGVAAQSASGAYGELRACAAIVGHADLLAGDAVAAVLGAEIAAGNGRFKGIRHAGSYDADPAVLGPLVRAPAHLLASDSFRAGFAHLSRLGLSFDAWILEPQIGEVTDLARAFPDTQIVLDHVGTPLDIGSYSGKLGERFDIWRKAIQDLAACPNVSVKLGGLGMPFCGAPEQRADQPPSSQDLAAHWKPYIDTCIEAFGPERGMFESNFPVDRWAGEYATVWNAFKRLAAGASPEEKRALFAGTAAKIYGVEMPAS